MITHPAQGLRPLLFSNRGSVGSFTSHKNQTSESAVRRGLRFSSLSEKTRKSIRLQISLQRQHFLLSYLKDLRIGPAGVWTRDLPPNNLFSWKTERAAEIQPKPRLPSVIRVGVAPRLFLRNNTLLQNYACDHNLT